MLRVLIIGIQLLCWVVAIWILFSPTPYWASIAVGLLLLPTTLVVLKLTRTDFTVQQPLRRTRTPTVNLAGPFVILSVALFMRTFLDFNFPDRSLLLSWLAIAALIVGLALWVVSPASDLPVALFIGLAYAYPLLAAVNSIDERIPYRSVAAEYVRKYMQSKPYVRTIVVTAEGRTHQFIVDKLTYELFPTTQPLCTSEYTGLLGIREVKLSNCTR